MKKKIIIITLILLIGILGFLCYEHFTKNYKSNYNIKAIKIMKKMDCSKMDDDELFNYMGNIIDSLNNLEECDEYRNSNFEGKYKILRSALDILQDNKCINNLYYDKDNEAFTFRIGTVLNVWEIYDWGNSIWD